MACVGWEVPPDQMMAWQISQKAPVPNRFLYGQWAELGAGLHISTATCHALHLAISAAVLPKS